MNEMTRGEFRHSARQLTEDFKAAEEWVTQVALPRFEENTRRVIDEVHAAVRGTEMPCNTAINTKIMQIAAHNPALGTAIGLQLIKG